MLMAEWFQQLGDQFMKTFVEGERWHLFWQGFGNTILISLFAVVIGVIIGLLVGVVRVYHNQTGKWKVPNAVCRAYVSVIRGTPMILQLMIWYYIIFASLNRDYVLFVAVLGFGLNSGAYVSEIIRGGIQSIDVGQMEAGRSLGLSQVQTMRFIILPQAVKNSLPALGNEFIVLLKETSVAGTITVIDLTQAANLVRANTYEPFFPLIAVAVVYWVLVTGLSALLKRAERRMAKSVRG